MTSYIGDDARFNVRDTWMNIAQRAKAIVLTPQKEWHVIAGERATRSSLFGRYVALLALIPAVAQFIGATLIGGYTPVVAGLVGALVGYVLSFVVVYLVGLFIDAAAPTFSTRRNFPHAVKLAVYSHTPVWLAGIFLLVPGLAFLMVLGLYGAYLLWTGLPLLMNVPDDRPVGYVTAIVVVAAVLVIGTWGIQRIVIGLVIG
jgi:hypothetical protein